MALKKKLRLGLVMCLSERLETYTSMDIPFQFHYAVIELKTETWKWGRNVRVNGKGAAAYKLKWKRRHGGMRNLLWGFAERICIKPKRFHLSIVCGDCIPILVIVSFYLITLFNKDWCVLNRCRPLERYVRR